jgi:hypothetical protein
MNKGSFLKLYLPIIFLIMITFFCCAGSNFYKKQTNQVKEGKWERENGISNWNTYGNNKHNHEIHYPPTSEIDSNNIEKQPQAPPMKEDISKPCDLDGDGDCDTTEQT